MEEFFNSNSHLSLHFFLLPSSLHHTHTHSLCWHLIKHPTMSIVDEFSTAIVPAESTPTPSTPPKRAALSPKSIQRAKSAALSLSQILGPLPDHLPSSKDPALALLNDPTVASSIFLHLRKPNSGAGDDNLCRWFYDTFQSTDPLLQLVVLRFLPLIAGMYLSRCTGHHREQPLAGFEAVLLALYAHETVARDGNPMTINLANVSVPSAYHEGKAANAKGSKNTEEPTIATAVISAVLEPHGTVRSTKRARIVAIALELYYSKISDMPIESKLEFCHFASSWAGHYEIKKKEKAKKEEKEIKSEGKEGENEQEIEESEETKEEDEHKEKNGEKGERIPLPWELLLPTLRIVGHCLLGQPSGCDELKKAAATAAKGLHERAMHDMNAQGVLATRSLMMAGDDTILEPSIASVYSIEKASEANNMEIVPV